jgi:2-polyprenyl-3-methyl-5-hydroxy-6-metoxy-1,4-benzoquinol methylase
MLVCILSTVFFFCIALAQVRSGSSATDQFYRISKEQWEKEYTKGEWAYLDRQAIERARAGVIVNMFYDMYGGGAFGSVYAAGISNTGSASNEPPISHLLDVGCGPGTLSDYLRGHQRRLYEGIDLSSEAINTARKLRADSSVTHLIHAGVRPLRPEQFQQADCMEWEPPKDKQGNPRTYGTIVFNEMLYYVDHKKILERYQRFLAPDGIFVISVWFNKEKSLRDTIFADARRMMQSVDEVEFTGVTYTGVKRVKMPVSFHVEAFRPKRAVA